MHVNSPRGLRLRTGGRLLISLAVGSLVTLLAAPEARALPAQLCITIPLPWPIKLCFNVPSPPLCDAVPTGIATEDYYLPFKVPKGLMPDPAFDKRKAKLRVHRVRPVYAHGKCHGVPSLAAVLIHGRSVPGSPAFDLRLPTPQDPAGGAISVQEALARSGIDTFAPDLLGYGLSTHFDDGLDDPCNASLPGYEPAPAPPDTCLFAEGCDRTRNAGVFPLNQQTRYLGDGLLPVADGLGVNPLAGERCAHSSHTYFARTDVFARDIAQVIDDAIGRAKPKDRRVVLVGSSFGGPSVARTLYLLGDKVDRKVSRVVFLSSLFNRLPGVPVEVNLPTEEKDLPATERSTSFPLALGRLGTWAGVPADREASCTGRVIPGSPEALADQMLELDPLGASWGGSDPDNPTGLLRSPTFTNYGWNREVAATFTLPTLILHGLDDTTSPPQNATNIFDALTSVEDKVLVEVECGSHQLHQEGCSGPRCDDGDPATLPYGGSSSAWAGPHSTISAALIEWVKTGTVAGASCGHLIVDASGVANGVATPHCATAP